MTGDPRVTRIARRVGVALLLLYTAAWLVTRATRGPTRAIPDIQGHADVQVVPDTLTVMTLNLAHGRSTGFHQLLTSNRRLRDNLEAVAAVMNREGPDVVAVQEADGPSVWSGRFDHVEYVADAAGYPVHLRGDHVLGPRRRWVLVSVLVDRALPPDDPRLKALLFTLHRAVETALASEPQS